MKIFDIMKTWLGVAVLVGTMIFSITRVVMNERNFEAGDLRTIRICHWQLESGFREALQELIDEYEAYYLEAHGERVRVLQLPISEKGYAEFINTGLIGGTAPDIIEKGKADTASEASYVARFFKPLGDYILEPNPYNVGTPLEGVPWQQTFFDGMQSAYDRQLLDYYYIPFSMFSSRMFYNKDIYHAATGRDEPPSTYEEFIETCEQIQAYADKEGLTLSPIAGSRYQAQVMFNQFWTPFLIDLIRATDLDLDGETSRFESYLGYRSGVWNFYTPAIEAAWDCNREVAQFYQAGWMAAERDDAVFMFVQGRAAIFVSGSWDASSLKAQVADQFELDVFTAPVPVDHPVYSRFVKGGISEASAGGGIPWAITQRTRHEDLCIDFLRFCTTQERNARFNKAITWLPVIRGTPFTGMLERFKPIVKGFSGYFDMKVSTELALIEKGLSFSLLAGQMGLPQYQKEMTAIFERTAASGYKEELIKQRRNNRNLERVWASYLIGSYVDTGRTSEEARTKALQMSQSLQDFDHQLHMFTYLFEQTGSTP